LFGSVTTVLASGGAAAARQPLAQTTPVDWNAVQDALGRPGTMMPGDVFRIGMPRTDLQVTVNNVPVQAGFALGSYAAFKQYDDGTMVMGDVVLLDQEVTPVMSALFSNGFEVSALHNHLNNMAPHMMYLHYEAHGDAVHLAERPSIPSWATPAAPMAASFSTPSPARRRSPKTGTSCCRLRVSRPG
jgi:hypothetical protein